MTAERHAKVADLFQRLVGTSPDQRSAMLDRLCGNDGELRAEVEALLAHDADAGGVMSDDRDALGLIRALVSQAGASAEAAADPAFIGPYRVVGKLGTGGMGTVYEVLQQHPTRTVALKLLHRHGQASTMSGRFSREIRILGRLHHPCIAQVFEAGTADVGNGAQSFFTMELIRGCTLLKHAAGTTIDERLLLMSRICEAVDYAHSQGVIHRDLKPSNILIDEHGHPKIVDFGVARESTPAADLASICTAEGQLIGTIAYMSPEQVSGRGTKADARSDVYALGVIMYELLTGRLPYDIQGVDWPRAVSMILDEEPSRMKSLNATIQQDLETIVCKALSKEPQRRYASAKELGEDIRRYLGREPIAARRASSLYHARKFASRHPGLVGGVLATILALVVGIILVGAQLARARTAEHRAERERARVQEANGLLVSLLAKVAPENGALRRDVSSSELLADLSDTVSNRLQDSPQMELEIREALGRTCMSLGLEELATSNYAAAAALAERLHGEQSERAIATQERQAWSIAQQLKRTSSREVANELIAWAAPAVDASVAKLGAAHPTTLRLRYSLAVAEVTSGRVGAAKPNLESLCAELKAWKPADRPTSLAGALSMYAVVLGWSGQVDASGEALRQAEAVILAESIPSVELEWGAASVLGGLLEGLRRVDRAEAVLRHSLSALERDYGENAAEAIAVKDRLALLLMSRGKFEEASRLWEERYRVAEGRGRVATVNAAWLAGRCGMAFGAMGNSAECEKWYDRAISLMQPPGTSPHALAVECWVSKELWRSLGPRSRWASEALYWNCRRLAKQHLIRNVSAFENYADHWSAVRLSMAPYGGKQGADGATLLPESFTIDDLQRISDPAPGVYSLTLRGPSAGRGEAETVGWVLVMPIEMELWCPARLNKVDDAWWNDAFNGTVVESRSISAVGFDGWWDRGFGPLGSEYYFCARGEGNLRVPEGTYRLRAHANDGIRVWIDDHLLLDRWEFGFDGDLSETWRNAGGAHTLRFEYFQHGNASSLWIWLEPVGSGQLPQPAD